MCEKFHNDQLRNDRALVLGKFDKKKKKEIGLHSVMGPVSGSKKQMLHPINSPVSHEVSQEKEPAVWGREDFLKKERFELVMKEFGVDGWWEWRGWFWPADMSIKKNWWIRWGRGWRSDSHEVDSSDEVMHIGQSDQWRSKIAGRATVTADEERVLHVEIEKRSGHTNRHDMRYDRRCERVQESFPSNGRTKHAITEVYRQRYLAEEIHGNVWVT